MEHDFYWISGSPNSWRAMLALEHKGVAYKSHRLDPSKREQKDAAFLVLNPLGTVPALKLGGTVITESIAIMAYLGRAFPSSPLFGESALETGLIWQRIFEFVNGLRNLIDEGVVRPLSHGTKGDGSAVLNGFCKGCACGPRQARGVLQASDYLATTSRAAVLQLRISRWYPIFRCFFDWAAARAHWHWIWSSTRCGPATPAIAEWFARLEMTPAYQASYPPHWRLTPPG